MANGTIVTPQARWRGRIELGGKTVEGTFKIFDSGGAWELLFGKPLLVAFGAVHDYEKDVIVIKDHNGDAPIPNQTKQRRRTMENNPEIEETVKTCTHNERDNIPICIITDSDPTHSDGQEYVVPTDGLESSPIFTRHTDPHNPHQVQAILDAITIGPDITKEQRDELTKLIADYADCFALSVSEVKPVKGAVHKLDIPHDAKFPLKVNQRPLTPPQRKFLYPKIDEMIAAGVLIRLEPSEVKCIAPTVLSQKAHEQGGLSQDELQHRVNEQCVAAGLPPHFDLPPRQKPTAETPIENHSEQKWRICQNFGEVNKVTRVAPMPQGDIRMKQQRLSRHRWLSVFDFASGFYAVTIHPESRPYTAFYMEGRGYLAYAKMPFGLTGAPSTFAHVTAMHLYDLLAEEVMELLVDDGGAAANVFKEMIGKLTRIFQRIRERDLSLSAAKSKFFMTEAVFAGARVGPNGVQPDQAKLTAIVDWERPRDARNLAAFVGITGWFRDLIKGYAKIEGPLRDLLRGVELPEKYTKTTYRRIMAAHKLDDKWHEEHTRAFLALKAALTSEPVLRGPKWDGTPFVITTDGSKDAFAGVLAQRNRTVLENGKVVEKLHPLGFASKRTSHSEEKYKPFLLEFAALKFALDKFSDITWGFPIEIETDCFALRDFLMNDKLGATHARWRDGILAHRITDVRHIPGRINVVADGLSRKWEGQPRSDGDGSNWSVSEDWEAAEGLVHDVFSITPDPDAVAMRDRFRNEAIFREVVEALLELDTGGSLRERKRAWHRASQYMIENNKLWKIAGGTSTRARSRVECVTKEEAKIMARKIHEEGGHWRRDAIKIALTDAIWSPKLDDSIIQAISECARCKNFGATHIHVLLDPITRRHPFELLVGDYLKLPTGKGGFHTIGLYLDTCSQHAWADKLKTAGSAKNTCSTLKQIYNEFAPFEMFMTDGGTHFNNEEVRELCREQGTVPHVVAAYAPWVNGLVENTNKLLLHILKRLCAPELGEDDVNPGAGWDSLPRTWPVMRLQRL
jgi:transposase InsO family protein